jgi:hypothetical protein
MGILYSCKLVVWNLKCEWTLNNFNSF